MKLPVQTAPIQRSTAVETSSMQAEVRPSVDLKPLCIAACKALPAEMQASCLQTCGML